jgi:hypothetical protein
VYVHVCMVPIIIAWQLDKMAICIMAGVDLWGFEMLMPVQMNIEVWLAGCFHFLSRAIELWLLLFCI